MTQTIIDLLDKGRQANNTDRFRKGNLISVPNAGTVVITGDLHGHRRNFQRIVSFADLVNNPDRHVILQEIIHGGPEDEKRRCLSFELLFNVIRYKVSFPDQVHIIMGNHDTAFINQAQVMKNGKEMNTSMLSALKAKFGEDTESVELAMRRFLFSEPLAVKCPSKIWLSHSLPDDRYVNKFDKRIFDRELKIHDVVKPNSAYLLTWGRRHTQETLDKMAQLLDADIFVLGHQPQEKGFSQPAQNLLIIASDHNHGVLLPLDLSVSYTIEQLVDSIVPLASIP